MRYLAIPLCVLLLLMGLNAHASKPGSGGDTTIETRVTDLEAAVADNAVRLDAEEAATAAADGRISTLESSSAATDTRVTAVESGVAAVQAEVTGNGDRLTAVEDSAAGTDAAINNLDARVGALEAGGGLQASVFLGVSSLAIQGNTEWYAGMKEACATEYGVGAYVCTEKELWDDPLFLPSDVQASTLRLWVRPTLLFTNKSYTGVEAAGINSCSTGTNSGFVYNPTRGGFDYSSCAAVYQVMCCR